MNIDLVIITPCSRRENLLTIKNNMNFDIISKWYIIYDNRHFDFEKCFNHDKIVELSCKDEGHVGHQIREMALQMLRDKPIMVYFLDDDNIVHPNFWNIIKHFEYGHIYTFDMEYNDERILKGNKLVVGNIDTAQYVFDIKLIGNIHFNVQEYGADGIFIQELGEQYKDRCVYIPEISAYYNKLR